MKVLAVALLLSILVVSSLAARCSTLSAPDTTVFQTWHNSLSLAQKTFVNGKLSISAIDNTICGSSSPNIVCDDLGTLTCYLTTLDLEINRNTAASNSWLTVFPNALSGLANLQSLTLNSHQIAIFPATINNFLTLSVLSISDNVLTSIPTQLAQVTTLTSLDISFNRITGNIPTTWPTQLTKLESFKANNNRFTGTIPTQWSGLTSLRTFAIGTQRNAAGSNTLTGSIPTQWSSIPNLTTFTAESNALTGSIPTQWKTLPLATFISSSNSQMSGTLPDWTMSTLQTFGAASNGLTGTLPPTFGNNAGMTSFDVSFNSITGTIPSEYQTFVEFTGLSRGEFKANDNQLQGTIPYFFMTNPDLSDLDNSGPQGNIFTALLLDANFFCPKLDYTYWGVTTDYNKGCDMCALSLNNTAPLSLCDASKSETCIPDEPTETYTCFVDPKFEYFVYSETSEEIISSTASGMTIRFVGSDGETTECAYRDEGYGVGDKHNETVLCNRSVGTVWSVYITFNNPKDFWHIDNLIVTHNNVDSRYKSRVAVRNNDLLEAEFQFTLKVNDNLGSGTPAKVYAVLRDNRNYQQNLNFLQAAADGEVIQRSLIGYNLDNISKVFLGHYSADQWKVDYVEITKRGVTTRFTWNKSISRKNRPLAQTAGPIVQ